MQVHPSFERETKSTVGFAEDEAEGAETHPGAPVIGTLYLQTFAWAQLGKPERLAASVEALAPKGVP